MRTTGRVYFRQKYFVVHVLTILLIVLSTACSEKNNIDKLKNTQSVNITGSWFLDQTIDLCGPDIVEKSKLEIIGNAKKVVLIKQTYLNGITYSRGDPDTCEEEDFTDSFLFEPSHLLKDISVSELQQFLPEWDGLNAAYAYSVEEFNSNKLVVRAVKSGHLGDIETRTYTR